MTPCSTKQVNTVFGPIVITLSSGGGVITSEPLGDDAESQTVESVVLAHACAGVDVESPAYVAGINTALEAIDNDSN